MNMPCVLGNRILKAKFRFEEYLCPGSVLRVCKYPAFVVLRLNDEYSVARHKDVINLRSSIFELQGNVIQEMVIRSFEIGFKLASDQCFTAILKWRISGPISTKPIANDQRKKEVIGIGHSIAAQFWVSLGLMLDLKALRSHFRSNY